MSEPISNNPNEFNELNSSAPTFLRETETKSAIPWGVWAGAGLVCLIVIAILLISGHKAKSTEVPGQPDAYSANVAISNILMSEASNMAGVGKLTYIDGTLKNNGGKTISGVTVKTIFSNDMGQPPQVELQAIQLIRAREPYIDTEPVSAEPIQPGQSRDFRLIFEQVTPNWNQVTPAVTVMTVKTK